MARNWLKTLFRASYKGRAFWVASDIEAGSRRIVVHEFPMRDDPFLEDLGEGRREFRVTAYVASDAADSEANALLATCATRGPGVLVLPTRGPVLVRCLDFERVFEKDRLGYSALELKFVREGFGASLATVASLGNLIFVASADLGDVTSASYASALQVNSVPDYVLESAISGLETAVAALEAVRVQHTIDTDISAAQAAAIESAFEQISVVLAAADPAAIQALALAVVEIAVDLAAGMPPVVAVAAFEQVVNALEPVVETIPSGSRWQAAVTVNQQAGTTLLRLGVLMAYCESIERLTLSDRQAGIALRAKVAEFFDEQLGALAAEEHELYHAVLGMRDATIEYLSRTILDLAPVAPVSANLSMPSLYWAWRLYADPARSGELVARNHVLHPSFMPLRFEALTR